MFFFAKNEIVEHFLFLFFYISFCLLGGILIANDVICQLFMLAALYSLSFEKRVNRATAQNKLQI